MVNARLSVVGTADLANLQRENVTWSSWPDYWHFTFGCLTGCYGNQEDRSELLGSLPCSCDLVGLH